MPESTEQFAPAALAEAIEAYLAEHPAAAILEDGQVLFDMHLASYSISTAHGRCVLQLWSDERNLVRSIVSLQYRTSCLRLMTRRMGVLKPVALELVPTRDRRTPTARDAARRQYLRLIQRVLLRRFPDHTPDGLRSATDLEHSFGPAYARGRLLKGTTAEAVIGVGSEESSSTVDGILTLGLLWLDHCRKHTAANNSRLRHFTGLKIIVPAGTWRTTAERLAWLNHNLASFQLFTLDERSEELIEIDYRDIGNLDAGLVHAFDATAALSRAQVGIDQLLALLPPVARSRVELRARSASEVSLSLHGLEFACVRHAGAIHSFAARQEITFGAGAHETSLTDESAPLCRELLSRLFLSRHPDGQHTDPLFRLQPERWLESQLRLHLEELMPILRGEFLYNQVPALSTGDRGMLDLLTVDRDGRLVVIEVKANEDMQLPMQGLDYWIRVRTLHADRRLAGNRELGAFERHGYFTQPTPGAELSSLSPRLLLVAPALRIHPSNEIVLRYLSPEVEWELVAVSEHWRQDLKVVFRKRSS